MKKIHGAFAPLKKEGVIRIIIRTYGDDSKGKKPNQFVFEGKLNPEKNVKQIEKILFSLSSKA